MIITKERGLQSQLVEGQSLLGYLSQLGENKERRSEGEKNVSLYDSLCGGTTGHRSLRCRCPNTTTTTIIENEALQKAAAWIRRGS